jgi:RHS repeat-associated protein
MKYDYMSRRVEKKILSGETVTKNLRFVYDSYKLIEELDGLNSNSVLKKFIWNGETPFSMTDIDGTFYYVLDANKNVSEMIDTSGVVRAHYEYSPFGKIIVQSGDKADDNPIRFSSEYMDEELGLVYYNHRYYSPELGRWLSRDGVEELGGANLYAMCFNAPVNFIDMLGLEAEEIGLDAYNRRIGDFNEGVFFTGVNNVVGGVVKGAFSVFDAVADYKNSAGVLSWAATNPRATGGVIGDAASAAARDIYEKAQTDRGRGELLTLDLSMLIPLAEANALKAGAAEAKAGAGATAKSCNRVCKPQKSSLSNEEARAWYNEKLKEIDTDITLTEENAKFNHAKRNELKRATRDIMSDRNEAARLDKQYPLQNFNYYKNKYRSEGYSGEDLWRKIIEGAKTPNAKVNAKFGIKEE